MLPGGGRPACEPGGPIMPGGAIVWKDCGGSMIPEAIGCAIGGTVLKDSPSVIGPGPKGPRNEPVGVPGADPPKPMGGIVPGSAFGGMVLKGPICCGGIVPTGAPGAIVGIGPPIGIPASTTLSSIPQPTSWPSLLLMAYGHTDWER